MQTRVVVSAPICRTPRVQQVEGMFDLPPAGEARLAWDVSLPIEDKPWHIGLIVGPSGSGKSTVARALFGDAAAQAASMRERAWPEDRSVLDGFPPEMPVKEVVELLSSVGFSSPPAWLRPWRVLSTGEQFRAGLARLLAYGAGVRGQGSGVSDTGGASVADAGPGAGELADAEPTSDP
jgi:ABC-type ATPase with predicted acetyltransferase domain